MNAQSLITVAITAACMLSGSASAEEKEITRSQVPKAVVEAFEKAHPDAKDVEYERENFDGKEAFEVEYKAGGNEYELLYQPDGNLLQKEEEIDAKALPEPVRQAIAKAHPNAGIKEAEKVMSPDGAVVGYEVEIKASGKTLELELDSSGKILKTEKD